ncbi:MAG TPA: HAMP domain-containing sensor histidine kinase [Pirellulaceae bacterium]|nr:HAMP domain-containing sensor histidine kinase [Pirellulaceae bacterium]
MSKKQFIVLSLIVCLPLASLAWLGARLARNERAMMRQKLRELLTEQLKDTDQVIGGFFALQRRDLLQLTERTNFDTEQLRAVVRKHPRVSQMFVLEPDGRLLHPPRNEPLNQAEQEFLSRAQVFLLDKDLIRNARGETDSRNLAAEGDNLRDGSDAMRPPAAGSRNWYVWYWGRGLNLIFYQRLESGHIVGVELERSRWIADLIAELPQTAFETTSTGQSRIQLVDSNDELAYQWGALEPPEGTVPFVELPLRAPLSSWRLKYYVVEDNFVTLTGRSAYVNLLASLAALGLGLLGLAVYFYRESSRESREATTRVNFVNHVSHELKTPLTNIRMYAELLEHDLQQLSPDEAAQLRPRLGVIVSESRRLSRLIGNVLMFARQERQPVALERKAGRIDTAIRAVIQQFEPTMRERCVDVRFEAGADLVVEFDFDAVEQILINLINNVEKYAANGKMLEVASRQSGDRTTVIVSDCGAGVSTADRENIFEPFYRVSDRLEQPAGAGIGLSIARRLARQHGGDLVLLDSDQGARFQVDLHTPRPKE